MSPARSASTSAFNGFPSGKTRTTPVPEAFFNKLLPSIDHLGELKLSVYVFWYLNQLEGNLRYVQAKDILADQIFIEGLAPGAEPKTAAEILDDALRRAVARGTLLMAEFAGEEGQETCYFLNSPRGRAALRAIQRGDWHPGSQRRPPVALELERPNIYRLYEENIGPLTPLIADALREAEETYPPAWVEEAFKIAVENNVRRWRYVEAILRSWKEKGRDEQDRGDTQKDRRRYVEGEFADFIEH
jgi:DNA replication protein